MKKLILLLCFVVTAFVTQAQVSIATARATAAGQVVTVSGIVTVGAELGVIRYMQDATAGIAVYDNSFSPNRGDSVTVTGTLTMYNGLLELTSVTGTIHTTGNTLPNPLVVLPLGMNNSNEGQLLKINNVTFANAGGTFANGTLAFTDGTQTSQIYLNSGHSLIGTSIPQTAVNLTGLSAEYNNSPQLLLRDANDIEIASTFYVTTAVTQSNLTTAGFNLSWETNIAGSSNVQYGLTPAMGTHMAGSGSTSNHSIALTGLTAGEIYYAQVYSVDGTDTAWASPKVYATVSNSSGTIEIYFNQPVNTGVSTGTNATYINGINTEAKIVSIIDNANISVDLTAYNFTRTPIVTALNNAVARGVEVRVIADDETGNSALQNNTTNFNWFTGNANGLMHNKFIVVDPTSVNDALVLMGSMNFTDGGIYDNYNNFAVIKDQSLAKTYRLEFNEMWGTDNTTFGIFTRKLGEDKTDNTPHNFIIGGVPVESYFSPSDGTTAAISRALQTTDSKLEFCLLTFTRNDLGNDVINLHNAGVNIRGMIENVNDTGGEFPLLVSAGVNVRDDSVSFLLHHKYCIIDEDAVNSDPMVVTGSHNWTTSAETSNDENTLIFHDATIANLYAQEFSARWIGIATNTKNVVTNIAGFSVNILGNPVQNVFRFQMENEASSEVVLNIYNVKGQLLKTENLTNVAGTTTHNVDIQNFAAGQYVAVFHVNGLAIGKKIMIAH